MKAIGCMASPSIFWQNISKWLLYGALGMTLLVPQPLWAKGDHREIERDEREIEAPASIVPALKHLLALVKPEPAADFDPQQVAALLEFVNSDIPSDKIVTVPHVEKGTSAYMELTLNKRLAGVLKYAYNPELPAILMSPSSTRLSHWKSIEGKDQVLPKLWQYLPAPSEPMVLRGIEEIENTPDLHTGAYYRYDLNRVLILYRHQDRNVLLSLSGQNQRSEVGKKGAVVGPDEEWNYLYSGITGLDKFGLGWVDSYMYASYSVIVYSETRDPQPKVKVGIFKWLRAGWKNINMVKTHHIHNGLIRFSETYKHVLESSTLPKPSSIADYWSRIEKAPTDRLRRVTRKYFSALEEAYTDDAALDKGWVEDLLGSPSSAEKMKRREMQSILFLEYLKKALGKQQLIDIDRIDL